MKYVFINLKNFAVKNVLIFILFIVCAVTDVLIICLLYTSDAADE